MRSASSCCRSSLVTWLAFFRQEIPSFPPEGYSLRWFGAVPANKSFVDGFLLSLQVGIAATLIGLALARAGEPRARAPPLPRPRALVNALLLMPLVVPGVVLGTSIYVFQIETEIATGLPLLGSPAGLVAAPRADRRSPGWSGWSRRALRASIATIEEAAQEPRRQSLDHVPPGHAARRSAPASSPARCSAS